MKPRTVLLVAGAAGFSTRDVWEGYREGLTKLGVHVIPYATFSMLRMFSQETVGNDIVGKAHDVRNRVDAVVFIDGLHFQGQRSWVPLTLRQSGMLTALVKTDDPYSPVVDAHHLYDVVFNNELAACGDEEVYLPTATLPAPELNRLQQNATEDDRSDIVFVGTLFEDRAPIMLELAAYCEEKNLRLRLAGNFPSESSRFKNFATVNVMQGTVRPETKWRWYANARLVLNLFREADGAVSPSPRVFEVTALGGPALLSGPRRSEVTRIFGQHVYEFDDVGEMKARIDEAMENDSDRNRRAAEAQRIALAEHLYEHRATTLSTELAKASRRAEAIQVIGPAPAQSDAGQTDQESELPPRQLDESRLAWIIGCGRTGSTWLCEMLDAMPQMHGWHEPYFGRLLKHLVDQPDEARRPAAFFFDGYRKVWVRGLRDAFYRVALRRYPGFSRQALVVKEVNTPEFFGLVEELFPLSGMILLLRDPFDVLDSYIDMRKEGSWNRVSGKPFANSTEHLAVHIAESFQASMNAFEGFPSTRKIELRYEQMLDDPRDAIRQCCGLVGIDAAEASIEQVVSDHQFDRHADTGARSFRRFGKAGIWQDSGNFDAETLRVAESVLGDLRKRIGYT